MLGEPLLMSIVANTYKKNCQELVNTESLHSHQMMAEKKNYSKRPQTNLFILKSFSFLKVNNKYL